MYDVVIIGMGVAGSFLGLNLNEDLKVLAIDSNEAILKKFLISGGGINCNIANLDSPASIIKDNTTQDGKFLFSTFSKFAGKEILQFLDDHEIKYQNKDPKNNRYYLMDGNVNFRNFMEAELDKKQNLKANLGDKFKRIIIEDDKIIVFTDKGRFETKKIVFAVGGASYSGTGSTGFSKNICEALDLKFKPLYAVGNSLNLKNNIFHGLSGISLEGVKLSVVKDKKIIDSQLGDMMITHGGIGGPVARRVSFNFENYNDLELIISFMKKEVVEFELFKKKYLKIHECFKRIPRNFRHFLLDQINIKTTYEINNLTKEEVNDIIDVFSNFKVKGISTFGLRASIATAGGIDVKEIDPTSMMLKSNPNIFFIGECLSTGMKTGGYNVTMCLSSAKTCANYINGLKK